MNQARYEKVGHFIYNMARIKSNLTQLINEYGREILLPSESARAELPQLLTLIRKDISTRKGSKVEQTGQELISTLSTLAEMESRSIYAFQTADPKIMDTYAKIPIHALDLIAAYRKSLA
ncbi:MULTISPECIES: hypothetical protein [unclassified Massilia]|uniref:hypothetical protein n=1 Tax=unclassified Massilia TaxID=2609279 RepID=UPI00067C4448|nr:MULTISPECIES: hypothetical protein [unclassified Massilia]AKU21693.1 hypothetical protein ACZ75_09660 [Massilia sp. NR 4-1]UMR28695.1 hypothetical protein MJ904_16315 [Massilia sp. MB5]UTY60266.1 hypothetical protein HPQ68_25600 [Massilia sp. erpn]